MVKSSEAVNMIGIEKGGDGKGREGRGGEDAGGRVRHCLYYNCLKFIDLQRSYKFNSIKTYMYTQTS